MGGLAVRSAAQQMQLRLRTIADLAGRERIQTAHLESR